MKSSWLRSVAVVSAAGLVAGLVSVVGVRWRRCRRRRGCVRRRVRLLIRRRRRSVVISASWSVGGGGVVGNNFPAALPGPFAFHKTLHVLGRGTSMRRLRGRLGSR